MILVPLTFFFWFASAFPAQISASGIDTAEWRVFFALVGLVGLVWIAWAVLNFSGWTVLNRVLLVGVLVLVAGALIVWTMPEDGAPLQVDRADWFWLLALLLPGMALRRMLARRLWAMTPLDIWMALFLVLGFLNIPFAPYPSRGLGMLMRPLLGMAIVVHVVETARTQQSITGILRLTLLLSLFVGIMGLLSTQWNVKSDAFSGIIERLPEANRLLLPGTINPNEIGGALAWLVPYVAAMFIYPWRRIASLWRLLAALGFAVSLLALVLGQSRFALVGVVVGLSLVAVFAYARLWRYLLAALILLLVVLEGAVLFNLIGGNGTGDSTGLSARDESTSMQRTDIWKSAVAIIGRYPLTGAGMNRFRSGAAAADFPIAGFDVPHPDEPAGRVRGRPPHAHNELLQLGSDFGIPGIIFVVGLYGTLLYMAIKSWWVAERSAQVAITAAMAGLLAHAIYGIGDAIPLWDRFAWLFWILVGIVAAQYLLVTLDNEETQELTLK
jgi:O-antigen ligase